jgi:hypothetical protein
MNPAGPIRKTAYKTHPVPAGLNTKTEKRNTSCSRNFFGKTIFPDVPDELLETFYENRLFTDDKVSPRS